MPDDRMWVIRDVHEPTRRTVKKWSGEWGCTIAEALLRLVMQGDKVETAALSYRQTGQIDNIRLIGSDQMEELAKMVAEQIEKQRKEASEQ